MMAARGNAAKKAIERKANAEEKRKSTVGDEITADDLVKFKKQEEEREKNRVKDKWSDPECAGNPLSRKWMEGSRRINRLAYGDKFGGVIMVCILLAGVLVGIQTYEGMEEEQWVVTTDLIILGAFSVECILKIFSEGLAFWRFWLGPEWKWNNFDFIVVVLCLPVEEIEGLTGGNVAFLRLMRLARLVKIVKKVPQLQMIVMGLAGGLKSIGYILLLLFLVFYLYGILGMFAFRDNDPWHFRTLEITLLTLFRASTLEDWTDIMYISIWGCDRYASTYVASE